MAINLMRHRFTVEEYHQMAEAGIFGEDDRVELIEGEVIEMTPIGQRHAASVARNNKLFERTFGDVSVIWVQNPIQLSRFSVPQPDLALLQPRSDFYASGHPRPPNVLLLVEVADSSLEPDRRVKIPLYGRSGVLEAWLVDLEQETVTAYRDPDDSGYRTAQVFRRGEQLVPLAFSDRPLSIDDILG